MEVDSAGVLDLDSAPALPDAVEAAAKHGLDLSDHRSKPLTAVDQEAFDLFIGFELDHVAFATVDAHIPRSKVFTFGELVRLLDGSPPRGPGETPLDYLEGVAARRTHGFDAGDHLADPLGRSPAFFEKTADQIVDMCERLAGQLFGSKEPD